MRSKCHLDKEQMHSAIESAKRIGKRDQINVKIKTSCLQLVQVHTDILLNRR